MAIELPVEGFDVKIGGHTAIDLIKYGHANDRSSGLEIDRLSVIFQLECEDTFEVFVEPDLLGVDTRHNLWEAWAAVNVAPELRLSAGHMPIALGTEFATRAEFAPLMGYSFTSYLDGRYDWALRADGELFGDLFWYQATYAFGEGFDLEGRSRNSPQFSGRFSTRPLRWTNVSFLEQVFAGIAYTYSPDYDEPIVLATPSENTVFITPDLDGRSAHFMHIDAGWVWRSFRVGFENVRGEVNGVPIGGGQRNDVDQLTSYAWSASWFLTGEQPRWSKGGWTPVPDAGSSFFGEVFSVPGALELAARYSNADIDRSLFDDGITTFDPSTQEVRTFSCNLFWYPYRGIRTGFGYQRTIADHELSTFGGTNRDSTFVLRLDLSF